ncbi:MAG: peptide chain release factor N(5)-glutamine methyltransferase [Bacilli bacterium]|nr:peptide chain release factor N(5)-glutamine methyltransferase [Bacilli bacterium]
MTIEELLVFGKSHCHSDHAKLLLAEILDKNPLELLNYLEEIVSDDLVDLYKKEILALEAGRPLQYVIGSVNFFGSRYFIDERVLIPRFETEELVENTIKIINNNFTEPIDIVDLGCGSGVIGLTLEKKMFTNSVDLIDISKEALEVADINCKSLNSKANLIQNNFLNGIDKKYDLIISNPPYIKQDEDIDEIVKNNEPSIALYGGETGLDCYKEILSKVKNNMKDKCLIAFEIGYTEADDIINLVNEYLENVSVEVRKDLSEKDRMLFIYKNIE